MADKKKYYDYLKNYSTDFITKHETWSHYHWGRRSNYMQLFYHRAYYLFTGRGIIMHGFKVKHPIVWLATIVALADVYGVWVYQEMYNKLMPWKYVYYQPEWRDDCLLMEDTYINDTLEEKKPMTRMKYADVVKIVYNGKEEQDTFGLRRFRYR